MLKNIHSYIWMITNMIKRASIIREENSNVIHSVPMHHSNDGKVKLYFNIL